MKYLSTQKNFFFLVGVSSILFLLQWKPTSGNLSTAGYSIWPCTMALSAMINFQCRHFDTRSPIQTTIQSIRRSHSSGQVPRLRLLLRDWGIAQTYSICLFSFPRVVKQLFCGKFPIVSAADRMSPILVCSALRQTCWVCIWIELASVTTDFGTHESSHYIVSSQWWSTIQWWISDYQYSKQSSGVLNKLSRVMWYGISGLKGLSKVLEYVTKVWRQGKYICGLGGVILIRWHYLGPYSARTQNM